MTFENEIYQSFKEARQNIIGGEDNFRYFNPSTGRPIKNLKDYKEVVLYSENTHMGYHGMVLLKKVPSRGVIVTREVFDQEGNMTFNDMWEVLQMR